MNTFSMKTALDILVFFNFILNKQTDLFSACSLHASDLLAFKFPGQSSAKGKAHEMTKAKHISHITHHYIDHLADGYLQVSKVCKHQCAVNVRSQHKIKPIAT